jgi:hypothetical protein
MGNIEVRHSRMVPPVRLEPLSVIHAVAVPVIVMMVMVVVPVMIMVDNHLVCLGRQRLP